MTLISIKAQYPAEAREVAVINTVEAINKTTNSPKNGVVSHSNWVNGFSDTKLTAQLCKLSSVPRKSGGNSSVVVRW